MYKNTLYTLLIIGTIILIISGCTNNSNNNSNLNTTERLNTPTIYEPIADGLITYGTNDVSIDASHLNEGYIMAKYQNIDTTVKLQITTPSGTVYTYNLSQDYESFPLTNGNGMYQFVVFENVYDDKYATTFSQSIDVTISNTFGPYLYPNQYVNFNSNSKTVAKGCELAKGTSSDLEVVEKVYDYIISNISYDNEKAKTVQNGYIPIVDTILSSKTGICFDYAAIMATMLRSQNIPTRLEVGYAGNAYHAWISVHLDDLGWVNGIIEFDGKEWNLMDPTFAANNSQETLKNYIGNGDHYQIKYMY